MNNQLHVISSCSYCAGIGFKLKSVGPIKFKIYPICNGYKGRCETTLSLLSGLQEIHSSI